MADERNDPRLLPQLNPLANERNDPQVSVIIYTTPSGDIDDSGVFAHRLDDRRAYFCSASFPRCRGKGGIADDSSGLGVCVVHACLVFLELGLLMGWWYEVKLGKELTTLSITGGLQGSLERNRLSGFHGLNALELSRVVLRTSKLVSP